MVKESQKIMFDHSKAKVELYGGYLAKYLNIISRDGYTKKIFIYDLFCGEGTYENGGKGSPIIALETIQELFGDNPFQCPKIKINFNDINLEKIEKLKSTVNTISFPANCTTEFTNNDYNIILQNTINEINKFNNEKGIVFIDPYGYKEIKIEHLKNLLANRKSEVLLFLPSQFMFRFANSAIDDNSGGKEHLHRFIKEVFGEEVEDFKNAIDFIERLKEGFKNSLNGYFVDSFTLERERGQFFAMYFFTSHIKGFEKMLETKWEIDANNGRGYKYEKSGDLFSSMETNDWEGKLKEYLLAEKRYNGDLYKFTLHSGFLPKHTNQILTDWLKSGQLSTIATEGQTAKKGAFYLNYKDYHAIPKRIQFKLN